MPPLPLFPTPKPPPPPWLHGPQPPPPIPQPPTPNPNPPPPKARKSPPSKPLTARVPGGRTRRTVLGIIRRVRSLELTDPPSPNANPKSHFSLDLPLELRDGERPEAVPWAAARDEELKALFRREKRPRAVTRAEAELPAEELERLRRAAGDAAARWVRAKKAGVTGEVVEEVEKVWRRSELAAVKVVDPLKRCMDRAREIVEIKTGGLVIWSKRDILVVYRGSNRLAKPKPLHNFPLDTAQKVCSATSNITTAQDDEASVSKEPEGTKSELLNIEDGVSSSATSNITTAQDDEASVSKEPEGTKSELLNMEDGVSSQDISIQNDDHLVTGTLYEREVNRLLDTLGPRFIDWWWNTPLPVDADLLPEVVPGFRTPFRQCPPGVRLKLADEELTYLRKLARPLPTHFALGRNTKLQGLAAAILKLWEKSLIAKIAVKVGIQNTSHQQMAWELKRLTGGTLILRNKDFIILYRGKDFLPGGVAGSIIEREAHVHDQQLKEEEARSMVVQSVEVIDELSSETSSIGTFREYQDIQGNYAHESTGTCDTKLQLEAAKHRLEKELKDQERKLFILTKKIERSDSVLAKLHSSRSPTEQSADQELLTEEERVTFRKIGLRMDEHMLLGRRGIFDGVIEDIHQHWKHKEVVKVITKQKQARQITYTAKLLEIETGGTVIAIKKLTSSYAIILYRGKNYRRPTKLAQSNLLTKREALQKSIEVQRRGSMKYFARRRQRSIMDLKRRLGEVMEQIRKVTS